MNAENKLLSLIQKKKGFFESILELTETELQLSFHEWMRVLEQKKILLSCIDEIDQELHHYKDNFHALSQEISEEIDHLKVIIEKILHLDRYNQDQRRKELKHYIKS